MCYYYCTLHIPFDALAEREHGTHVKFYMCHIAVSRYICVINVFHIIYVDNVT